MIRMEKEGRRLYLIGDTFAIKGRIKGMGGHWDGDRRAWWIGVGKQSEVESLLKEIGAGFDLKNPVDRAIRADQLEEAGRSDEAERLRSGKAPKEDPDNIRLTGKGEYKGRSYYLGARTRDGQRVRCLTLPDDKSEYLDFWADVQEVRITKTYQPREVWDGRWNSGRTRTVYTTLGGIAAFVRAERKNRKAGGAVCAACGTSGELVEDLEDGLMKHHRCCDMPPG
jgi:hypothetical protein